MGIINSLKEKTREILYAPRVSVPVQFIQYSEDKQSVLVRNVRHVSDAQIEGEDTRDDVQKLPEYLNVTLDDLDNQKRSSLEDRANPRKTAYISADSKTGGVAILQGLQIGSDKTTINNIEAFNSTARWVNFVARDVETKGSISMWANAQVAVKVYEAGEEDRRGKERSSTTYITDVWLPQGAVTVANKAGLEATLSEMFDKFPPNLRPQAAVRIFAGDEIEKLVLDKPAGPKDDAGRTTALTGEQAVAALKRTREWTALDAWFNLAKREDSVTIEVIPGFQEFKSKTQLENMSSTFDAKGRFTTDEKRAYYNSRWTMSVPFEKADGTQGVSKQTAYFDSVLFTSYNQENHYAIIQAQTTNKGGASSLSGTLEHIKTANWTPTAAMVDLIQAQKSNLRSTKIEDTVSSNASEDDKSHTDSDNMASELNNNEPPMPNEAEIPDFGGDDFEPQIRR